jgi:hypothetical protein
MLSAIILLHPAAIAGEFSIHRAADAPSTDGASALAVVTISPFDDVVLADGLDHYYLVRDESEQPIQISVHKNAPQGAVRIGFDDESGLAAPVDPSESSVTASPAILPADGVSMSQIVIIPRDTNGVPLGSGLDIQVDTDALEPGFPCGPLTDMGDGTYVLHVASALAGMAEVWISVEGVPIDDEPTVTFEYAGGATDLRDLAKQNLDGVSDISGAFEEALAGVDPGDPGAVKVQEAWDEAIAGLDVLNEDNYSLDNDAVDNYLKSAIGELVSALDDPGDVDPDAILGLIDDLLDIGRMVAQFHLNRAVDSCGQCDPDEGGELCDAEQAISDGDAERASGDPDYEEAANQYGTAIDKALDAYDDCAGA